MLYDKSDLTSEGDGGCAEENHENDLILKEEKRIRSLANSWLLIVFLQDVIAAFLVVFRRLITLDSLLGASLTAGATYWVYDETMDNSHYIGSMDFILLSFTVVLPISATIRFAFSRREEALAAIAVFKSSAYNIYTCHAIWHWGKALSGNRNTSEKDWLKHSDEVLELLFDIGGTISRFVTLPTASLPRHRELPCGQKEAARTIMFGSHLTDSNIASKLMRLSLLLEELKLAGLTPSEASRERQWEQFLSKSVETLRIIKTYRTPQALRAYITVASIFLPPFYAPNFAQMGNDMNSLPVAMAFSVVTSLTLIGLHQCVRALEDPFVTVLSLDGVDVEEELSVLFWQHLQAARKEAFPSAPVQKQKERKKCLVAKPHSRFYRHLSVMGGRFQSDVHK